MNKMPFFTFSPFAIFPIGLPELSALLSELSPPITRLSSASFWINLSLFTSEADSETPGRGLKLLHPYGLK